MQTEWIFSSTFLPFAGDSVEFMLEEREQPIHGTFVNGVFHSRWADYEIDRVQSWRAAEADPSLEAMPIPKNEQPRGFIITLKRLARMLSRSRNTAPPAAPRSHARTSAAHMPMLAMTSVAATGRGVDSNQMSS